MVSASEFDVNLRLAEGITGDAEGMEDKSRRGVRIGIMCAAGLMVTAPFVMARLTPEREIVRSSEDRAEIACRRQVGELVDYAWNYPDAEQSIVKASTGDDWIVRGAVDGRRGFSHPRRWYVCSVRLIDKDAYSPTRSTIVFDNGEIADEAAVEYRAGNDWPAGLPGEVARR